MRYDRVFEPLDWTKEDISLQTAIKAFGNLLAKECVWLLKHDSFDRYQFWGDDLRSDKPFQVIHHLHTQLHVQDDVQYYEVYGIVAILQIKTHITVPYATFVMQEPIMYRWYEDAVGRVIGTPNNLGAARKHSEYSHFIRRLEGCLSLGNISLCGFRRGRTMERKMSENQQLIDKIPVIDDWTERSYREVFGISEDSLEMTLDAEHDPITFEPAVPYFHVQVLHCEKYDFYDLWNPTHTQMWGIVLKLREYALFDTSYVVCIEEPRLYRWIEGRDRLVIGPIISQTVARKEGLYRSFFEDLAKKIYTRSGKILIGYRKWKYLQRKYPRTYSTWDNLLCYNPANTAEIEEFFQQSLPHLGIENLDPPTQPIFVLGPPPSNHTRQSYHTAFGINSAVTYWDLHTDAASFPPPYFFTMLPLHEEIEDESENFDTDTIVSILSMRAILFEVRVVVLGNERVGWCVTSPQLWEFREERHRSANEGMIQRYVLSTPVRKKLPRTHADYVENFDRLAGSLRRHRIIFFGPRRGRNEYARYMREITRTLVDHGIVRDVAENIARLVNDD